LPAIEAGNATCISARAAERLAAAVREAGALALSMFQTPIRNWTKGPSSSPVSEADIAVDKLLRERLTAAGDGIAWLSEESADDATRLGARYVWIVDPIDGTRAYIAGLPDWAVSAALIEDHRPVVACLFAPALDEFFMAPAPAPRSTARRSRQRKVRICKICASPGRKIFWSGWRRCCRHLRRFRGRGLWPCVSPVSRRAPTMSRSLAATAMIGTLRQPIFWCTKRAARSRP
jgi:fructose-1,6-bisphosphatase/inositol monophosphatase family enzyme